MPQLSAVEEAILEAVRSEPELQALRTGVLQLKVYTVATAPSGTEGQIAYFSDGAAGHGITAFYNGSAWIRSDTGLPIAS